ncbi:MAG: hypothetical protein H6844_19460 [Alphaproteobacteria bacterium]|nr:hypothetical protein [Alphaproteobacteria bacterium]
MAPAVGSLTINGGSTVLGTVVHIGSTVNSTGTLMLNDGTLATGAADTYNEVKIGNNGTGALSASNGGQILMTGQPFFAVGRRVGSSGDAVFDASSLSLTVDSGADFSAGVQVGRDGGGSLTLNNGSSLSIIDSVGTPGSQATYGEVLMVGRDGGPGSLTVDASTIQVSGTGASFHIARGGAQGTVDVRNGSSVKLTSTSNHADDVAVVHVGQSGSGNTGVLTVENSTLTLDGQAGGAFILIGSDNTNGEVTFSGTGTAVTLSTMANSAVQVGRDSGNGLLTIENGASVALDGDNSNLDVGRDSANGIATITGAGTTVTLSSTAFSTVVVGRDSGNGILTVEDGATLNINGDVGRLDVGRVGATGTVHVTSGGKINAMGSSDGDVFIGAAFADFGRPAAGIGTVVVEGAGSELNALDGVYVGSSEVGGGGPGTGTLTVRDGATINATNVYAGTGGVLNGDGTINANLIVDGGTVAPGNSPGTLTVNGDFDLLMGTLLIEIAGTGAGEFDVLNVSGDATLAGGTIEFQFLNGFSPLALDGFDFLNVGGTLDLTGTQFEVSGLGSGFQYDLSQNGGVFSLVALNDGSTQASEPAAAGLLGVGLLALWTRSRFRVRR